MRPRRPPIQDRRFSFTLLPAWRPAGSQGQMLGSRITHLPRVLERRGVAGFGRLQTFAATPNWRRISFSLAVVPRRSAEFLQVLVGVTKKITHLIEVIGKLVDGLELLGLLNRRLF